MDKLIDLINQGGTGEYDARQERGEAVAWVRCHPDGTLTTEFLADAAIEPVRRNSKAWIPLYLHPTPDAGRVAEQPDEDFDPEQVIDEQARMLTEKDARIAALESQLAESREREGRMREALTDLIGAVRHLNPCPATLEKAEAALAAAPAATVATEARRERAIARVSVSRSAAYDDRGQTPMEMAHLMATPAPATVAQTTDCRSDDGVTVGLIDGIIATARVLRQRDQSGSAVREALADLRADEDFAALVGLATEPVAQGGGVDVEKVMALVEEYADASHAERIDVIGIGGCEASRIRNEIRALLTAAPAIANQEAQE